MLRHWMIDIVDDGTVLRATITNMNTGHTLNLPAREYDAATQDDRAEAISELFAGPLPNIRDSFDSEY